MSIKQSIVDFFEGLLIRLVVLWQPPVYDSKTTIEVTYVNGESETFEHNREIKIDLDGSIYFKEGPKGKWECYPEIKTLSMNFERIRRPIV